ncbi:uncharacterized protein LOC115051504 isoform X2 [Echeneis naucrates]|uniref:uncharacterized protein LOC115051504 isoform X2 n=1 Tax=Echeneis naucrates TaxID=173247 RepID=UPI0011142B6D|nr:uncharacterized protein LOC115051504 isoform X2 [Echeneis naucrates]
MDSFETPYDVEAEFIECTVCDKSIRGDTLYKIHLTTPGHIKKEDGLVAVGLAVRQQIVPEFKDILQYLDYLKLDEPIIGLSFLDEVPGNDQQLKYSCRLCHLTTNLPDMVHHVIGRKHRQKYVELKRPDLVTWDKQSIITQGGKIIRARAEIIERQDGRGTPNHVTKRGTDGKSNILRVSPRQRQNQDWKNTMSLMQRDLPKTKLKEYEDEYSHQEWYPSPYPEASTFHPDEPHMNRDRQMNQREDNPSCDYMEDEQYRVDYRESNTYSPDYMNPGNQKEYKKEYFYDPNRRATLESDGVTLYDPKEETQTPRDQIWHVQHYPNKAPPNLGSYAERDHLKEFYSEEVRRRQVRSDYKPSQPFHPNDEKWSLDRESAGHDRTNRARIQGSSEPEAKRRSLPTSVENDQAHGHLFNIIKDYQHQMRDPLEGVAASNPGLSRTGPPFSHRRVEVTRTVSGIPEPFRRFLTGDNNEEPLVKRKRKSRFSDATAEEVEMTKEMFSDDYRTQSPRFGGHPRPVSLQLRPESHGTKHPDLYTESQSPRHAEMDQRGGSGSQVVFDVLKNIEIETPEEADFLKHKLCSLLREFKSKKSEMALQNSEGGALMNNYKTMNPDPQLSLRHQYERTFRQDLDLRKQDYHFKDDSRGRDWKQHERIPGVPGCPEKAWTHHATHPDESGHYSQRFQEPMFPSDYQPATTEYFHSNSSSSSLLREQDTKMHRGPQYSKNLDKITSTLLELVARK